MQIWRQTPRWCRFSSNFVSRRVINILRLLEQRDGAVNAARSHLKTTQVLEFPKGSEEALEDLEG